MEFKDTMLVVKDMAKTKEFYTSLMGLAIKGEMGGVNVSFEGGLAAQTEGSWAQFTNTPAERFRYGGHDVELYFETKEYDAFVTKAKTAGAEVVSESVMPYGQKVIRIYDPDKHIVEVGEDMGVMVRRMRDEGLTVEQIADKTFLPPPAIGHLMNS